MNRGTPASLTAPLVCECGHLEAEHGHPATPSFTGCFHGWAPLNDGCLCEAFELAITEDAA